MEGKQGSAPGVHTRGAETLTGRTGPSTAAAVMLRLSQP